MIFCIPDRWDVGFNVMAKVVCVSGELPVSVIAASRSVCIHTNAVVSLKNAKPGFVRDPIVRFVYGESAIWGCPILTYLMAALVKFAASPNVFRRN